MKERGEKRKEKLPLHDPTPASLIYSLSSHFFPSTLGEQSKRFQPLMLIYVRLACGITSQIPVASSLVFMIIFDSSLHSIVILIFTKSSLSIDGLDNIDSRPWSASLELLNDDHKWSNLLSFVTHRKRIYCFQITDPCSPCHFHFSSFPPCWWENKHLEECERVLPLCSCKRVSLPLT